MPAHGGFIKKHVGTFGDIGTFSFYPGKNLGAYGDAGAIVTNNKKLFLKSKMIANHGRINKFDNKFGVEIVGWIQLSLYIIN